MVGWPLGVVWVELHLTLWTPDLETWTLESAWMRSEEVWVEARSMENKAGGRMVLGVIVPSKGGMGKESFHSFLITNDPVN